MEKKSIKIFIISTSIKIFIVSIKIFIVISNYLHIVCK